ncbi:MAG TPA: hypothetical protein VM943_02495 [Pyrinomonadaceae bacterium]|nr:hypothetical protein [Pyrinomonadaceae bacterium]
MGRIFMAGKEKFYFRRLAAILIIVAALTAVLPATSLAHEGEDHGESKAPAIAAGTGMVTRTARAGDWEIVVKHPTPEPDKETPARVFVTRFETNEPIANAQVSVVLTGAAAPVEAVATAGSTPGVYEVRLLPLPQGEYRLAAQVGANGRSQTAQYGAMQVASVPPAQVGSSSGWARTALIALALLAALGLGGVVAYRFLRGARASRESRQAATV